MSELTIVCLDGTAVLFTSANIEHHSIMSSFKFHTQTADCFHDVVIQGSYVAVISTNCYFTIYMKLTWTWDSREGNVKGGSMACTHPVHHGLVCYHDNRTVIEISVWLGAQSRPTIAQLPT